MAKHKYGAVATEVDGHTFPSKREAKRYGELKLLEKAGEIRDLQLQPYFRLSVGVSTLGAYVADFRYFDVRTCAWVVEDVKSTPTKTPMYRWKVRHLKAEYGIDVKEV